MTLQELLSSDMDLASLAALVRQGFAWWIDELAAMLPAVWRDRLSSRARSQAEPLPGGGWRFWHGHHPLEGGVLPKSARDGVGILMPTETVLLREVPAPRMPAADVRRMLSLDIDRLSPLPPDLIHFDLEVVDRDAGDGTQRVLLGVVPRAAAARVVEAARKDGLFPASLGVRTAADAASARFDFLPGVLEAAGVKPAVGIGRYLWGAVGALLVLNVAVLIGRDIADVSRLSQMVDAQRPMVSAVLGIRGRVEAENKRRSDLVARAQKTEPLRMLNALTQATPVSAWIHHLEWNGQALRVIGLKPADIDMAAAIKGSGAFTNPRALATAPVASPIPMQPFDITADARAPGQP